MALGIDSQRVRLYDFYGPYDGTNGSDVVDWFTTIGYDFSISHEEPEGMYFYINPGFPEDLIPIGSFFTSLPGAPLFIPPGDIDTVYVTVPGPETLEALAEAPKLVQKSAAVPATLAGQNRTVTVDFPMALVDSAYSVSAVATSAGGSLLGALQVTSTTIVDNDTVSIVLHNSGLLSLSGEVLVTAVR